MFWGLMDNLKECIEFHNHFSTVSVRESRNLRENMSSLGEINYDNSISLKEFLYYFEHAYKKFKEDFDKLPRFNLGESFDFWNYCTDDKEKEITLCIDDPTITDGSFCYLNIVKNNDSNEIKCYVSKNDMEYYAKMNEIIIDENFARSYLDFGSKYADFIDFYYGSNGNVIVSWQNCMISIKYYGNLYKNVDNVILYVIMYYKDYYYIANIVYDLDTLNIYYDKSTAIKDGKEVNKKEVIDTILSDIHIYKGRFGPYYSVDDEDKILRLKKGLDI